MRRDARPQLGGTPAPATRAHAIATATKDATTEQKAAEPVAPRVVTPWGQRLHEQGIGFHRVCVYLTPDAVRILAQPAWL